MSDDYGKATRLDEFVPEWTYRTVHGRAVDASVESVAQAIRSFALNEAHLANLLVAVRTLGRNLRQSRRFAETGDYEPGHLVLDETDRELCFGFVGRPWPGGQPGPVITDAEEFRTYEVLDLVKVAVSIRCAPADYGTLLATETRILVGPLARRPFDVYWAVVRFGSGAVRRSLLRAIARRAESAGEVA
jgi:hypothetical protein